jgi:hypothetical protein
VSTRRSTPLSRALIGLSVRGLSLDHQVRYREEFTAELDSLARSRQLRHAVSVLAGSIALRRSLVRTDPEAGIATARDWRCRLRWHHFQARSDPHVRPDGAAHPVEILECDRCGRYSTATIRRRVVIAALVLAVLLAWLLTPNMVALLLTVGVALGVPMMFIGGEQQMLIHGPGYQYRDSTGRRRT